MLLDLEDGYVHYTHLSVDTEVRAAWIEFQPYSFLAVWPREVT